MRQVKEIRAETGEGRYAVSALAELSAGSALVRIYGGTQPHIGAVSASDPLGAQACFQFSKHRELEPAQKLARTIAAATGRNVVVAIGVHIDNASREEVALLTENIFAAGQAVLQQMEAAHFE